MAHFVKTYTTATQNIRNGNTTWAAELPALRCGQVPGLAGDLKLHEVRCRALPGAVSFHELRDLRWREVRAGEEGAHVL